MKAWWNLNSEEKARRSLHCSIGCAVLALLFIVIGFVNLKQEKELINRCTETTTGEVISVFPAQMRRPQSYLTARFTVNGVSYKAVGRYNSGYSSSDSLSRKPVTVHYDKSDPNKCYAADAPKSTMRFICFVLAVLFTISSPAFIWQMKKIRKFETGND